MNSSHAACKPRERARSANWLVSLLSAAFFPVVFNSFSADDDCRPGDSGMLEA